MSKQYILIFAKTTYAKTPYDQWLAGTGIEPIILTPEEYASGYRHLPQVHAFANYDHNQLVEKTALRLGRRYPLVGVFARAEADVIRAGQLRDALDLPGQRTASALAYRNKVIMKDHLRGSGVLLPDYRPLDSAYTAIQFVEAHGFPVVIKPQAESGSFGTHILHDERELDSYLANAQRGNLEIETFVDGQMYHVDGLIIGGKIAFIHPFKYVNDCLSYRKNEFAGTRTLSSTDPLYQPLIDTARKVLGALPSPSNMAFHCELWHTKTGEIVFCEIASRTGGGMISSNIVYSFDLNIDKEWLLAECGLAQPLGPRAYRPGGGVVIPPLNGVLEHLPRGNEPEYVREVVFTSSEGQRFHGGVKSGLFLAGYVIAGDSEEEVSTNMFGVADWFAKSAKWQLST
ncbi:ATP-dependent carboxylate-amine ligase [Corallococcus sp. H22C18031201]|nr:ATP-dependent carboxylate-amine ligase [Corallococcus sp. H22C18031201]